MSPKLFGGAGAPSPIGGQGVALPDEAVHLKHATMTLLGEDILIEGEVEPHVHGDC